MPAIHFTALKDLCDDFKKDIVDGPFGANLKREHYSTSGIPVLKIQNIKPFSITLKKMDYVEPEKYEELKRHSYQSGDIIMTKLGNPLGESAIVEGINDGLIVADLVRIRASKVDTKYLCYHLNSPVTQTYINEQQKGTTRPRVRISVVRELPIFTPPLSEQKRIVTILDQVFADIEKARATAETNLKNARELFDSYLQQVFSQRGEGWENKKWAEILEIKNGKNQKAVESSAGKYPIIGSAGKVMAYADDYICNEGTTIIGRKGTINNPIFIDTKFWNVDTAFGLQALDGLDKKFLYYFCLSYDFTKRDKGSGRPSLVKSDLLTVVMPVPEIDEQRRLA